MSRFSEQLRTIGQQVQPIFSPQEIISRISRTQVLPETSEASKRVNTRLFLNEPEILAVNANLDIQAHLGELRDHLNWHTRDRSAKWQLVNAHGIATEYLSSGAERYHWYDGYMLTREVARDTKQRRRKAKEYFFVGRTSGPEPENVMQKRNIPGNPRVFEDPSASEIVITNGVSWIERHSEPVITGTDLTTTNPGLFTLHIPDEPSQAVTTFETNLAEQAAKQITSFPR